MIPAGVEVMIAHGHQVMVEKSAGVGSGFDDASYVHSGAEIVETPKEIFDRADMVMHVKEPQPSEYDLIREGQIVFTYIHSATTRSKPRRSWIKKWSASPMRISKPMTARTLCSSP